MIAITLKSAKLLRHFCINPNQPKAGKISVQTLKWLRRAVYQRWVQVVEFKVVQFNLLEAKTEMASSSIDDTFNAIHKYKEVVLRDPYMGLV